MKNLALFITAVLLTIALISCNTPSDIPEDALPPTEAAVVEPEFDLAKNVRNSYESWLLKGLKGYENNTPPADMTDFFEVKENISYLTLYDHMFEFDNETCTNIAVALFKFICDTYGPEALFDLDKRVEYKNAYLESLGLPPTYTQDIDVEKFFISMYFVSSDTEYPYHIAFDTIHYHFKSFETGYNYDYKPFHFHEYIYENTQSMIKMIDTIKELGMDKYLNTERDFHFYMILGDEVISYTTYKDGKMYINNLSASLHEAVHAMGMKGGQNIWLTEGLCNYVCDGFNFNTMYDRSIIMEYLAVLNGEYDYAIEAGNQSALYHKRIAQAYLDAGGIISESSVLDHRLLYDATSRIDLQYGNKNTLGAAREELNSSAQGFIGADLTYSQASSMVFYLVDMYGTETVVAACMSDDLLSHFGKTFEELKADWIEYLGE